MFYLVVRYMLRSLYLQEDIPRYPVYGRLGGPQSRYGRYSDVQNLLALPETEPRFLDRPNHSPVAVPTENSQLLPNNHTVL
jgi:hypothetical protein